MSLNSAPRYIVERAEATGRPGLLARAPTWPRVELGELVTIVNGAAFSSREFNTEGSGEPLVRIRDVGVNHPATFFSGSWDPDHRVRPGDVLIGMDGDFRVAKWSGPPALLNQRVCRLDVVDSRLTVGWLMLVLPGYLDAIWRETSSVTVKHLSSRSIAEIPIPIPPLEEQRRIVDILEDHLSRLDAAQECLARARQRSEVMRSALLHRSVLGMEPALVSDQVETFQESLPSGWSWVCLGDLLQPGKESFKRGPFGSALTKATFVESGYQVYEQYCPINDDCSYARYFITGEHYDRLSAFAVQAGDFLVSCAGTLGRITQVPGEFAPGVINQALLRIRIDRRLMHDRYFLWLFRSPYFQQQLTSGASGTAMVNLKAVKDLKAIMVPLPPLQSQVEMVNALEDQFRSLERLQHQVDVALNKGRAMRSAVMSGAFSGRLLNARTQI